MKVGSALENLTAEHLHINYLLAQIFCPPSIGRFHSRNLFSLPNNGRKMSCRLTSLTYVHKKASTRHTCMYLLQAYMHVRKPLTVCLQIFYKHRSSTTRQADCIEVCFSYLVLTTNIGVREKKHSDRKTRGSFLSLGVCF